MSLPRMAAATLAAVALGSLPPGAHAATAHIGAVEEVRTGANPDPVTSAQGNNTWSVQVAEATGTYAVPPGYGVITAWSHSTGGTPGAATFKVYRPLPANRYLALA